MSNTSQQSVNMSSLLNLFDDSVRGPKDGCSFVFNLAQIRGHLASKDMFTCLSEFGNFDLVRNVFDFQLATTEPIVLHAYGLVADRGIRRAFVSQSIDNADYAGRQAGTEFIDHITRRAPKKWTEYERRSFFLLLLAYLFSLCDFEVIRHLKVS
jgi:hypothetical protein